MAPRIEDSNAWRRCSSRLRERIAALVGEMTGATEPVRMHTWVAAWVAAGVRLRRRWLTLLCIDASKFTRAEIRVLKLVEVPYGVAAGATRIWLSSGRNPGSPG
jgi:hypothetical protein